MSVLGKKCSWAGMLHCRDEMVEAIRVGGTACWDGQYTEVQGDGFNLGWDRISPGSELIFSFSPSPPHDGFAEKGWEKKP